MPSNLRVLATSDEKSFYKLFGVKQSKRDGSLYFYDFREFASASWHTTDGLSLLSAEGETKKVSVHASGRLHVSRLDGPNHSVRFDGAMLHDAAAERSGIRHLLTVLPAEPTAQPR